MSEKRQALNDALKQAMKARDAGATSTLRLVLAKLKEKDIEARASGNPAGIGDADIAAMLQGMIKQRRESIELYRKGGRQDLVDRESAEIAVIERFLPQQLSEEAMRTAVLETVSTIGASGLADMGRTMAALKERHAGQMDFAKASALVREVLSAS
jgi:uncharacterized protein YqeY